MRKLLAGVTLVVVGIVGAAGVAGADSSGRWARYGVKAGALLDPIQEHMTGVSTAASSGDVADVEAECSALGDAIDAGRSTLTHSPSKRLNRLMREALTSFRVGSVECVAGDYTAATTSIVEGTSTLELATDEVRKHA